MSEKFNEKFWVLEYSRRCERYFVLQVGRMLAVNLENHQRGESGDGVPLGFFPSLEELLEFKQWLEDGGAAARYISFDEGVTCISRLFEKLIPR